MNNTVRVSIVTRTKNRFIFLKRLAKKLELQTYNLFEWVVVNDAGEDSEILDYIDNTKFKFPIIYKHITTSKGRSYAANQGVENAHGEFVIILDDDDFVSPDFLEKMISVFDANSSVVGVSCHTQVVIEEISSRSIKHIENGKIFNPGQEEFSIPKMANINPAPTCGLMIRKNIFQKIGGYPEFVEYTEDWCFNFKLIVEGEIKVLPEVLAFCSHRPKITGDSFSNTLTGTEGWKNHLHGEILWKNTLIRNYVNNGDRLGAILLSVNSTATDPRLNTLLIIAEKVSRFYFYLRLNIIKRSFKKILLLGKN